MTLPQENGAAPDEKNRPEYSTVQEVVREDRYHNTFFSKGSLGFAALKYANEGKLVFPLAPGGKVPVIPSDPVKAAARGWERVGHGHKDATTDPGQILRWWRNCPNANIGMPTGRTSGFLVVDIDGVQAAKAFSAMGDIGIPLIQNSVRGWHLFYAWSPGCEGIRNSVGFIGSNIDVRGEGGFIALAPSVRRGGQYSWQDPEVEPAPPPAWLLERLRPSVKEHVPASRADFVPVGFVTIRAKKALETMARKIETASFGEQEKTLSSGAWLAKRLVEEGKADPVYAERVIVNAGLLMPSQTGKKPWCSIDIERKVSNVMRRAAA